VSAKRPVEHGAVMIRGQFDNALQQQASRSHGRCHIGCLHAHLSLRSSGLPENDGLLARAPMPVHYSEFALAAQD
jgi:hypothetical protein